MLYPFIFESVTKKMIWGGESWDITCRENEMSVVKNGPLKGSTLGQLIESNRLGMLGNIECDTFPLLVKVITSHDFLSVQVHPDDHYARTQEQYPFGKNEMWYVLEAPEDGYLIIGMADGVTREDFQNAISQGTVENCLNKLPVKPGDVINIPAGLIHAIGKGIVLAEIQQNSDITYRVYDYGRLGADGRPRELHIEKALDVIDFEHKIRACKTPGLTTKNGSTYYIANPYFAIIEYRIGDASEIIEMSDKDHFHIFTCVNGSCVIEGGGETVRLERGTSVFIPAGMGKFCIRESTDTVLLKSFVPNIQNDFIEPLLREGYDMDTILSETSCNR